MPAKYLTLVTSTLLLFYSCSNDKVDVDGIHPAPSTVKMALQVKGASGYASEANDNQINSISIFSFSKKPGETAYTYEKTYPNLTPVVNGLKTELSLSLNGSLPRMLYLVANDAGKIPFLMNLQPATTSASVDELSLIMDSFAPHAPYTLLSKVELPTPAPTMDLPVEFTHTLSRLDIVNRYAGFSIDSMIVRDAVLGTYAFKESFPLLDELPRGRVKYTESPVYLYETNHSVLSIYGKYSGIRAVFDIDLADIKKATRYNVIFRSINDHDLNVSSNIVWKVEPWIQNSDEINTNPDWKY